MLEIWNEAVRSIEPMVKPAHRDLWLRPITCVGIAENRVRLRAPDRYHKEWFEDNFLPSILRNLESRLHTSLSVEFEVVDAAEALSVATTRAAPQMYPVDGSRATPTRSMSAPPDLSTRYTFDRFVVGATNQFAHAAARMAAESPASRWNPLFIYGGRYREAPDVLLVDDIQFLSGKDSSQDEFFHTFNALHHAHKQIVLTCDKLPAELPGVEERLRSRFTWGLITEIGHPDLETRVAILKRKAEIDHIDLPDDVALTVASYVKFQCSRAGRCLLRVSFRARASITAAPSPRKSPGDSARPSPRLAPTGLSVEIHPARGGVLLRGQACTTSRDPSGTARSRTRA
jgi:chromosomal replication initiator protein